MEAAEIKTARMDREGWRDRARRTSGPPTGWGEVSGNSAEVLFAEYKINMEFTTGNRHLGSVVVSTQSKVELVTKKVDQRAKQLTWDIVVEFNIMQPVLSAKYFLKNYFSAMNIEATVSAELGTILQSS